MYSSTHLFICESDVWLKFREQENTVTNIFCFQLLYDVSSSCILLFYYHVTTVSYITYLYYLYFIFTIIPDTVIDSDISQTSVIIINYKSPGDKSE